jgi:hypothetical protein
LRSFLEQKTEESATFAQIIARFEELEL